MLQLLICEFHEKEFIFGYVPILLYIVEERKEYCIKCYKVSKVNYRKVN